MSSGVGHAFGDAVCVQRDACKIYRSTRSSTLWTLADYMFGGPTKHTTGEPNRVTALEVGDRVNRKSSRAVTGRSRLVATHGLLSGGHEGASEVCFGF